MVEESNSLTEKALSKEEDIPVDILGDMFLFSPFENMETVTRTRTSLQPKHETWESVNHTPMSSFSRLDFFHKVQMILRRRLPEKLFMFDAILASRDRAAKIREGLKPEAIAEIVRSFDMYLTQYSKVFDQLGVPSIIWEKAGVIHYVNKAYVELTGFDSSGLPTLVDEFAFSEELSGEGLRAYFDGMAQVFMNVGPATYKDTFTFRTGLRVVSCSTPDTFVDGVMCVTITRDFVGLPLLFVGNFLPCGVTK